MRFPEDAPVTPGKRAALRTQLQTLGIDLARVDEQAIRASGPGGQKVNKTSSGVLLRYPLPGLVRPGEAPEQILVKWTRERHHALNRFLALRALSEAVEHRLFPATSGRQKAIDKIRKQKDRLRRRGRKVADPADGLPSPAPDASED